MNIKDENLNEWNKERLIYFEDEECDEEDLNEDCDETLNEQNQMRVTDQDVDEALDNLLKSHPRLDDLKECLKRMFNIEAKPLWEKAEKYSIKYGYCVMPLCDKRAEDGKCSCNRDYPSLFGCEVFECMKLKEQYECEDIAVEVLSQCIKKEDYEEKAYDKINGLLPCVIKNACRYHSFTKRFDCKFYNGHNDYFKKIVDEYFSDDYVIIRKLLMNDLIKFE